MPNDESGDAIVSARRADIPQEAPGRPQDGLEASGSIGTRPEPQTPPEGSQSAQERPSAPAHAPAFVRPEPFYGPDGQLSAYMGQRYGFPDGLVRKLDAWGLLYQTHAEDGGKTCSSIVFLDAHWTYAEQLGADPAAPFHPIVPGSARDGFWWFHPAGFNAITVGAYICESAVDAISLHLLMRGADPYKANNSLFCAVGDVWRQEAIDRIKAGMSAAARPVCLAVNNGPAGEECRDRNRECMWSAPRLETWNAEWLDKLKNG